MIKKTSLKGFTLIEMIIVIVIIGILAVVLTESYITISKTALRIEQEKNISEESLVLTQVFQAIADEATIDYDKYNNKLEDSKGFVDTLYLTGEVWSGTSIYSSGNCLDLEGNFSTESVEQNIQDYSGCSLIMEQNGKITPLTAPGKVVIARVKFKVIPYDSDDYYFENGGADIVKHIHQPAFWMFIHLYAPLYQPTGINKIDQPLQLFFNLNL